MSKKTFSVRSNAVRNARGTLGKNAKQGVHFNVTGEKPEFVWESIEDAPPVPTTDPTPVEATMVVAETVTKPVAKKAIKPSVKVIKAKVKAKVAGRKAGRKSLNAVTEVSGKRLKMFKLISSDKGASLDTLTKALGWQKHTVRGAVSTIGSQFKVKVKSFRDERRGRVYQVAGRHSKKVA